MFEGNQVGRSSKFQRTAMRIGVTGHQFIPPEALSFVTERLSTVLRDMEGGLIGVSSLAAGADQLFASLVLAQGGRIHVIVPCEEYEKTFSESEPLDTYSQLLSEAVKVETLTFNEPSEEAFLMAGFRVVDESELLVAIWDGKPAKGKGGTADVVAYARKQGIQAEVIWPVGISR